jgi:hypothetical protein
MWSRSAPVGVAVAMLVACGQPVAPEQVLQGSWSIVAAHRALEPATMDLEQHSSIILGPAALVALDPVSPGVPTVSVAGFYSSPTLTLDIRIDAAVVAQYHATLDRRGHLEGVITFSDAVGGGSDTVSYLRQ